MPGGVARGVLNLRSDWHRSFETASRDTRTLDNSQLVAKCEQILCMASYEFDERAAKAKFWLLKVDPLSQSIAKTSCPRKG